MSDGKDRLAKDLKILEVMADGMNNYLLSDKLYQQTMQAGMPQLTLGGYLMRQHRLQALADSLLDSAEQAQLKAAVSQYEQALVGKDSYLGRKLHRELEARLRQWENTLRELTHNGSFSLDYYRTSVETRAMIAALLQGLKEAGLSAEDESAQKVDQLDSRLRSRWQEGEFVWPEAWEAAYPSDAYWWLYGQPAG